MCIFSKTEHLKKNTRTHTHKQTKKKKTRNSSQNVRIYEEKNNYL